MHFPHPCLEILDLLSRLQGSIWGLVEQKICRQTKITSEEHLGWGIISGPTNGTPVGKQKKIQFLVPVLLISEVVEEPCSLRSRVELESLQQPELLARATIDLLKDTFGDGLISRFGPVNWPPRSCDLTPLDYFLWGYVKSLVYADKPQTLDPLENNIRRVIADIRPQIMEKVIENWTSIWDYIQASRGSPMPEITFKM
ncbi:uncharacterized protein TNCV_4080391 [Trichonephila clavipes]|nr:uncharacterized protein TNCV_4080391 [Trichonephila clavipes]